MRSENKGHSAIELMIVGTVAVMLLGLGWMTYVNETRHAQEQPNVAAATDGGYGGTR